jgi:septal ring factor EnvC (AmiA/AmiB activator)
LLLFFKKEVLAFSLLATVAQATPRQEAAAKLAQTTAQTSTETQAESVAKRDLANASAQAARLADARARQAQALQSIEAQVQREARAVDAARHDQFAADAALARAQYGFASLLPVMLRLSQYPALSVLAAPVPPREAVQGLLITRGLAMGLQAQATVLKQARVQAAADQAQAQARAAALASLRAQQTQRAAELDRVVAEARDQVSQAEMEGRDAALRVAQAAAQARNLRDAIAAMDAASAQEAARAASQAASADKHRQPVAARQARARQAAVTRPAGQKLSGASGQLASPVSGTVQRAFGAAAEDGPATGITYAAVPGAVVAAPCQGRVAFAAPFRSYGQLLIEECGGGYDFVLAGMASLAASPGHTLRAGEPVGRMAQTGAPTLYVELRRAGRPVDPAQFLPGPS